MRNLSRQSPIIGRTIAIFIILFILGWTAVRSLGARPPATPSAPMPLPALDALLACRLLTLLFPSGLYAMEKSDLQAYVEIPIQWVWEKEKFKQWRESKKYGVSKSSLDGWER